MIFMYFLWSFLFNSFLLGWVCGWVAEFYLQVECMFQQKITVKPVIRTYPPLNSCKRKTEKSLSYLVKAEQVFFCGGCHQLLIIFFLLNIKIIIYQNKFSTTIQPLNLSTSVSLDDCINYKCTYIKTHYFNIRRDILCSFAGGWVGG